MDNQTYGQTAQEPLETITQRERRQKEPQAMQNAVGLVGCSRDGAKELLLRRAFNLRQDAAGLETLANSLPTVFIGEAEFALYKILTK